LYWASTKWSLHLDTNLPSLTEQSRL
jgi:hypothetical protein